jgi:uncharacterized protein
MTEEDMIELATHLLERAAPAGGIPELECLDGFICGIVTAPELVQPSEWMPLVWGGEHAFASEEEAQRLTATLLGYYNFVVARLGQAPDDEDPEAPPAVFVRGVTLVDDPEDTEADGDGEEIEAPPVGLFWAMGFDLAHQLHFEAWEATAEEWPLVADILDFKDALLPPGMYDDEEDEADDDQGDDAGPEPSADSMPELLQQPGEGDEEAGLTADERIDVVLSLGEMLQELYSINMQREAASRTIRRPGPKVGRNDPCPCGSGRKYKVCHGAG